MDDADDELVKRLNRHADGLRRLLRYTTRDVADLLDEAATRLSALTGASAREAEARPAPVGKPCSRCHGKGGDMDTTYDRTGSWATCNWCDGAGEIFDHREVKRFLATLPLAQPTAVAAEREACAALADDAYYQAHKETNPPSDPVDAWWKACAYIATAIRARGTEAPR